MQHTVIFYYIIILCEYRIIYIIILKLLVNLYYH